MNKLIYKLLLSVKEETTHHRRHAPLPFFCLHFSVKIESKKDYHYFLENCFATLSQIIFENFKQLFKYS